MFLMMIVITVNEDPVHVTPSTHFAILHRIGCVSFVQIFDKSGLKIFEVDQDVDEPSFITYFEDCVRENIKEVDL
jgi:hypothetical protein